MQVRTTSARWGVASQVFHWVGALVVIVLIAHGWWMTDLAPRADRFAHYGWHGSLGYFVLALTVLRLIWRWTHAIPRPRPDAPKWERVGARVSHWGLYVFILGASVSGWALAGTFRRPLNSTLLGLPVPPLVSTQERAIHEQLEGMHSVLAWILAAIVVVHVAAAFYHLWVRRDDVMQRMLPGAWRREA
jgi:cytochrome b561